MTIFRAAAVAALFAAFLYGCAAEKRTITPD
jgi:hypothetical protein